jgi:hypothetical protein
MSYETIPDAHFRVVRDAENGHYHLQVGFGNHYRSFVTMKAGKLDQLRAQAAADARQASGEASGE